jgi:hypothetical protein
MTGELGLLIGLAGIAIAFYTYKRTKREKKLAYEAMPPIPIAEVVSRTGDHELSVLYEKEGEPPRKLQRAVIHFVRFANFGNEPIRESDVPEDDPLRIEVEGAEILDVSLVASTRDVCAIAIRDLHSYEARAEASIVFSFLDYRDGGLIQVITDEVAAEITMAGTIVGMPKGLFQAEEVGKTAGISGWGCVPPILFQLLAIAAVPLLYRRISGTWDNVDLLLLPVAALLIPFALTLMVIELASRRVRYRFAEPLSPPTWYEYLLNSYRFMGRDRSRMPNIRERDDLAA